MAFLKSKRFWIVCGTLILVGTIGAELIARFHLGLGDPPLTLADDEVEYRFKPGEYSRFGRSIRVNTHSMRSDEVQPTKTRPEELRVLFLGDSVLNGGAQTDHNELATTQLQEKLTAELGQPVWVGNASAGSWGPGNLLAYTEKFGWFDADVVVVVLSSHDAGDVMRFEGVVGTASFPDRKPWLALQEGTTRYLPRYWRRLTRSSGSENAGPSAPEGLDYERNDAEVVRALARLDTLLEAARAGGDRPVLLLQHPERVNELNGEWMPAHDWINEIAEQQDVETMDLRDLLREAISNGSSPYRDQIHLNARGQEIIVEAVWPWLLESLR